jgi:hypothetical protein
MTYFSPLVGRDSEHIMLAEALRRCRSGRGGVVPISGEAGIGKTRLVDEVFGNGTEVAAAACRGDRCTRPAQPGLGDYLELGSDVILTPAEMFASTPSIVGPPGPGVPGFLARAAATR